MSKQYKFFQYPRGVNKGGVLKTDICPTISTSSWQHNCLLIEIDMIKINKPKAFDNVEQRFKSHTLNEILPYLPDEDCFLIRGIGTTKQPMECYHFQ